MNIFYIFLLFNALSGIYYGYRRNFNSFNDFISKFFAKILNLLGYKYEELNLDNLPNKLIIIGSHTSLYDFFIGLFYYYAVLHKKYDTYILMKKEFEVIATPLLTYFDSSFKFISVDSKKKGLTCQIINNLKNKDNYTLFIAPEGTRKLTESLRSGYWNISKELNVDVAYLGIDFSSKNIVFENYRKIKDNWNDEQNMFIESCKKYTPLYPERCYWTKDFYNK
jgi:1-acyl-sn-glycerol-3-phosphate acyltransferase